MKRFFLGTFVSLVAVTGFATLAARWPALFLLLIVSMTVYLLFGRKADVEFRFGVGGAQERRLYGAVVWRHRDRVLESVDGAGSDDTEAGVVGRDG